MTTRTHRTRTGSPLAALLARLALAPLAVAAAPAILPAFPAAAQAQPAALRPLTASELVDRPLLWPAKVRVTTGFSGGGDDVPEGSIVVLNSIERDGAVIEIPGTGDLTLVPINWTDAAEQANARRAALSEDLRDLTLERLSARADLFPATVRLTEEVNFPNRVLAEGTEVGPYRLARTPNNQFQIIAVDPVAFKAGNLTQRLSFPVSTTDFLQQVRANLESADPTAAPEPRVTAELAGKLVDSSGAAVPEPTTPVKYYVIYSAASWCGWCTRFNPTIIKAYEEIRSKHPEVEFVYLGGDKSEEEMLKYLRDSGIAWPAVAFNRRGEAPLVVGMTSGGTPQVIVMTAEGRVVHSGGAGGTNVSQEALNALKAELARAAK